MGQYLVGQVCENGHLVTGDIRSHDASPFCSKCGEKTLEQCPTCKAHLRGDYHGDVVYEMARVRAFCFNCGKPYPWTLRQVEAAKALAAEIEDATDDEIQKAQDSLIVLTSDTPQTPVAVARIARLLKKAGPVVAGALTDILTSIATEAAKKQLGL